MEKERTIDKRTLIHPKPHDLALHDMLMVKVGSLTIDASLDQINVRPISDSISTPTTKYGKSCREKGRKKSNKIKASRYFSLLGRMKILGEPCLKFN